MLQMNVLGSEVRVPDGDNGHIIKEVLAKAKDMELDLVLIAEKAAYVCRII